MQKQRSEVKSLNEFGFVVLSLLNLLLIFGLIKYRYIAPGYQTASIGIGLSIFLLIIAVVLGLRRRQTNF